MTATSEQGALLSVFVADGNAPCSHKRKYKRINTQQIYICSPGSAGAFFLLSGGRGNAPADPGEQGKTFIHPRSGKGGARAEKTKPSDKGSLARKAPPETKGKETNRDTEQHHPRTEDTHPPPNPKEKNRVSVAGFPP